MTGSLDKQKEISAENENNYNRSEEFNILNAFRIEKRQNIFSLDNNFLWIRKVDR
jgi:hypothetical protein